jgi:PAB-dependent poly(A)-specific ribonuclease subunit 3
MSDGNLYTLRRIDSVKCVNHKICQYVMRSWLSNGENAIAFDHPGVVRFYKCFLSQRAVFFVHHYHAVSRFVPISRQMV